MLHNENANLDVYFDSLDAAKQIRCIVKLSEDIRQRQGQA